MMRRSRCYSVEQLSEYSTGGGSRMWRSRLGAHVEHCESCRAELHALKGTAAMLDAMPRAKAPDQWEAIRAQLEPRVQMRQAPRFVPVAATTAVMLVAVLGGLQLFRRPSVHPAHEPQAAIVSDAALSESHMTLAWNDPFSDAASLAAVESIQKGRRR